MKLQKNATFTLHAMVFNPILNIIPFFLVNVLYENQSHIGNALNHKLYLLAWALSSALGFYFYSKYIWDFYKIEYNKKIHLLSCGGMFLSCMIPYSKELSFFINDLHIWIAIISVCAFMYEWIKLYFDKTYFISKKFQKYFKYLTINWTICTLALAYIGHVSSLSEILFSLNTNIILAMWIMTCDKQV